MNLENLLLWWRSLLRFGRTIVYQYLDDDCQSTAAALTYQTLFAVVPLLTVMYSMFNAFEAFGGIAGRVEEFIFTNIVPENVGAVQEYLASFSDQARSLSAPSLALLSITAFLMLFTIERTFNEIWRVKDPRHGFQRFLMYWAIMTLGPLLIGIGFVISAYVVSIPLIVGVTETTGMLKLVPFVLSTLAFTLLYITVPNCVVHFRYGLIGGVLVAIAFEFAKVTFTRIMAGSNFEVIYGTFAAVPLFLLWVYLSWTIILAGAEIVKGLHIFRIGGDASIEPKLSQLILILELFFRAHQRGEVVRDSDIRRLSSRIDVGEWNDLKAVLVNLNLIKPLDRGGIVLSRDLKEISVWELYQLVPYDMPKTIGGNTPWEHDLAKRLEHISGGAQEDLGIDLETLFRVTEEPDDKDEKPDSRPGNPLTRTQ